MTDPTAGDSHGVDYGQASVDTLREPQLVLSHDLRVLRANRSFYTTFRSAPEQVEGRLLSSLGEGAWENPPLNEFLAAAAIGDGPV